MSYVYEHYLDEFDYFHLCGDDVMMIPENYKHYLAQLEMDLRKKETNKAPKMALHIGDWIGRRVRKYMGGGPGYGAEAQEIWSVDEELLVQLEDENVNLPILDMGIAHGEKARGGAY